MIPMTAVVTVLALRIDNNIPAIVSIITSRFWNCTLLLYILTFD